MIQLDNESKKYKQNEIVWGKVCGYPWWPGTITSVNKKDYEVQFFYEFSKSFLKDKKIKKFDEIQPKNLDQKQELLKAYQQALEVLNNENTVENLIQEAEQKFQEQSQQEQENEQEQSESKTITQSIDKNSNDGFCEQPAPQRLKRYKSVQIFKTKNQIFETIETDPVIKAVESNLQDLVIKIQNEEVHFKEDWILFQSVFETILDLDNQKVYDSQIGRFLKQLIDTVQDIVNQTGQFQRLLETLQNGLEQVQKKLIDGFFNYRKINGHGDNKRKKKIKKKQKIKIKRTKIILKKAKSEKIPKKQKIEDKKVSKNELKFKVKKRIAENLIKQAHCPLNKQQVEEITEKIEQHFDETSQNQEQYQQSFLQLMNSLQKKKVKFENEDFLNQEITKLIEKINNQQKYQNLYKKIITYESHQIQIF